MTEEQRQTIDDLHAYLDDLEYAKDEYSDDYIVAGQNVDGPAVCYVNKLGVCHWL